MQIDKAIKNAKRDLKKFQIAAKQTIGKERDKYLSGIDNLKRFISKYEQ
jgi:hypothetical protein